MEILGKQNYHFSFRGKEGEYFGIVIINLLLTILTLGIYYPWAKERSLKYLFSNTYLEKDNFHFSGTGKEMFIGFIKVYILFILLYAGMMFASLSENQSLILIFLFAFYIVFLIIIPFAIHGYYRYRTSRTSWRGIRWGYRGHRGTLVKLFFKELFLTIITFGIYGSWMTTHIRNYTLSHVRFGSAQFRYQASGSDYFVLNLIGILLTYITLGIYSFWYQRDLIRFYVQHLSLHQGDKEIKFDTNISASDIFGLMIINLFILIFTLGLGYPLVEVRTLRLIFSRMQIQGNIDLESLKQTEEEYKDAFGDEALDFLDIPGFI